MPELPEVEVTRRAFAAQIAGARIESVALGKPLRWPLGIAPELLAGRDVHGVRRRGKYLLMELSEGLLMLHLGMSGSLRFVAPMKHRWGQQERMTISTLQTSKGLLRLHDPRRFGAVMYVAAESDPWARRLLDHLGMEPLDDSFSFETFRAGLKASRTPIKQLLLNGSVVVGVGNIYASEVLFMARIAPTQPACEVGPRKVRRLFEEIRRVLALAVEQGGTTLRDFSAPDGMAGHFQLQAKVYGREGLPCTHCGSPVQMLRQGQRSTYFCARCQKAG